MIYFVISMSFVSGIIVASLLWSRDLKIKERLSASDARTPELNGKPPFKRVNGVLNEQETEIFKMLMYVLGSDGHVLAKLPLSSLLIMSRRSSRREFYTNIIKSREVDFVVCHSKNMAPVLVIHVTGDGAKTSPEEQQLIHRILDTAGLPELHLSARETLGPVELKQKLREAMNQVTTADLVATPTAAA